MACNEDIIVAPATLSGGAIAIVRYSGAGAIELVDTLFRGASGSPLSSAKGHTLHYGDVLDDAGDVVDDVVVSIYRAPHSYTGEESVEISCHGSGYIVNSIIELSLSHGARLATAGEFTMRAYMAGRIDLSQAEAVADMIASSSRATHRLASTQMRGGYSERLSALRSDLVRLSALLELELDFSEEDVEFADRGELERLMNELLAEIESLCESFKVGNAIKRGVSVAIVGEPNVGKSTLLNRLLGDDRAIVSSVAGTTRDTIEEVMSIDGVEYRFIDTAGLHETSDELEQIGIERTRSVISKAQIIIHMTDIDRMSTFEPISVGEDQELIVVVNKVDSEREKGDSDYTRSKEFNVDRELFSEEFNVDRELFSEEFNVDRELFSEEFNVDRELFSDAVFISARESTGLPDLIKRLCKTINFEDLYSGDIIVSNARHYEHLQSAQLSLLRANQSLSSGISTDLLSEDIRHSLHHIGSITGSITTEDILKNIFSTFCIGK